MLTTDTHVDDALGHAPANLKLHDTAGFSAGSWPFSPPPLTARHALLLDFDGTLVDIAATPEGVHVAPGLVAVLDGLRDALDGALAVISGRPIEQIDQLLRPLHLDVAGEHGASLRWVDGRRDNVPVPDLHGVLVELTAFVDAHPGLLLERKGYGVALHYRNAPELGPECLALGHRLSREFADGSLVVLHGKAVVELKSSGVDKGLALRKLMQSAPFAGRTPVFIGDDTTDEPALLAAQELGGIGIKVGDGDSAALHRLDNPGEVLQYLQASLPGLPATCQQHGAIVQKGLMS